MLITDTHTKRETHTHTHSPTAINGIFGFRGLQNVKIHKTVHFEKFPQKTMISLLISKV